MRCKLRFFFVSFVSFVVALIFAARDPQTLGQDFKRIGVVHIIELRLLAAPENLVTRFQMPSMLSIPVEGSGRDKFENQAATPPQSIPKAAPWVDALLLRWSTRRAACLSLSWNNSGNFYHIN